MNRKRFRGALPLALFAAFIGGIVVDSWLRTYGPPKPSVRSDGELPSAPATATPREQPAVVAADPTRARASAAPSPVATSGDARRGRLRLPIDGVDVESLKGGFSETRGGGRPHEAVDILAPRNTPIHAVEGGRIAKLFTSKAGGLTIYQFDPTERWCYYYAHLERYAGIKEGQTVAQGDVIGYVGTSGNAPANTPHLHFAVFELNADKHWWQGTPIDPYRLLKERG
jgi:murein DD-endopeptidase MepM/ murein hydrolase activator NlpD